MTIVSTLEWGSRIGLSRRIHGAGPGFSKAFLNWAPEPKGGAPARVRASRTASIAEQLDIAEKSYAYWRRKVVELQADGKDIREAQKNAGMFQRRVVALSARFRTS